jgi:hypothetical protein
MGELLEQAIGTVEFYTSRYGKIKKQRGTTHSIPSESPSGTPGAASMLRTHWEWRRNDLGAWRMLGRRCKAKSPGGRPAAARLGVAACCVLK